MLNLEIIFSYRLHVEQFYMNYKLHPFNIQYTYCAFFLTAEKTHAHWCNLKYQIIAENMYLNVAIPPPFNLLNPIEWWNALFFLRCGNWLLTWNRNRKGKTVGKAIGEKGKAIGKTKFRVFAFVSSTPSLSNYV